MCVDDEKTKVKDWGNKNRLLNQKKNGLEPGTPREKNFRRQYEKSITCQKWRASQDKKGENARPLGHHQTD